MEISFEKEYLQELYENGKTKNKKYRFQPQVVKGYLKCVLALIEAQKIEELFQINSLHYKNYRGIRMEYLHLG